ncbi:MAG: sterol desaturase/sphingolipid hydroxylase (fatty acid hydroxylase superfamily) [Flavobacteriaceae bacterium]|jgi:sterol desaturase/sphingolipid hydroxylase (fatty acid hydroxylase superfamily)
MNSKKLLLKIYYPLTILVTLLLSVLGIHWLAPNLYPIIPIALTLLFLLTFIYGEKFLAYNKAWSGTKKDSAADFLQTFIVLPMASKVAELLVPILVFYPISKFSAHFGLIDLSADYGFAVQFIVALLACEFTFYWFHRAAHHIPLLWRFHALHHGAPRVYWLNAGRFHILESFFTSIFYFLPLVFFTPSPEITILIITISSITGFLEHVNIDLKAGWLNFIFNTCQLHRWHHSKVVLESNKNYGKVLIVWDLLFGSYFLPKNREVEEVGIIEDDVPLDFIGQQTYPFKKKTTVG